MTTQTGSVFILEVYTDKQIIPFAFSDLESAKGAADKLGIVGDWHMERYAKDQYWCADLEGMINGVSLTALQITEYLFYDDPVEFLKQNMSAQIFEEVNISEQGDMRYRREQDDQEAFFYQAKIPVQLREVLKAKLLNEGFLDFSSDGYGINVRRWSYSGTDASYATETLLTSFPAK